MRRLLLPVRERQTVDAVAHAIASCGPVRPSHIVVLSVQPKPVEWQTRGLFREAIKAHLVHRGREACQPVARHLAAAGISYHTRVKLGDDEVAEILRCADEEGCDSILLQADRLSWVQRGLMRLTGIVAGSAASRVIHASQVPVTVVHA